MATQASYASATAGTISSTIDTQHLYYVHPYDNPGINLTNIVLNEHNYSQWSRSMELALSLKLKLGFVDGTYAQPTQSTLLSYWKRCNHLVISWLLNSISLEIRSSVVFLSTSKQIWDELEIRYAQSNLLKFFGLRRELAQVSQGTLSVTSYCTKFKTLTDEPDCMSAKPKCTCTTYTCAVNSRLDTYDQSLHLIQFLMGLSDQFTHVRGQILLMKPIPSLSQCYNMLLQEESQRYSSNGSGFVSGNVDMSVKYTKPSGYSDVGKNNKMSQTQGQRKTPNDPSLHCDYCHLNGSPSRYLFSLYGYPSWHKMYGKPKPKPKYSGNKSMLVAQVSTHEGGSRDNTTESSVTDELQNSRGLSNSQYKQLLSILQSGLKTDTSGSRSQTFASTNSVNAGHFSPNYFAGTFHYSNNVILPANADNITTWILDTGATDNITHYFHLLENPQVCESVFYLPNGQSAQVTHWYY